MGFNKIALLLFVLVTFSYSCLGDDESEEIVVETATTSTPGNCMQAITYVKNVNWDRLSGIWYAQYLSDNGVEKLGCDGTCWTLVLNRKHPLEYTSEVCCHKESGPSCEADTGSGYLLNSLHDHGNLTMINQEMVVPTFVLGTDYDTYIVIITCSWNPSDEKYEMKYYAYSRNIRPRTTFQDTVFELLKTSNFDPTSASKIPQGNQCNYSFECP